MTYCVQHEADFDQHSADKGKDVGIDVTNIDSVLNIHLIDKEINPEPPAIVDWDEAVDHIKIPKDDSKSLLTANLVKKLKI